MKNGDTIMRRIFPSVLMAVAILFVSPVQSPVKAQTKSIQDVQQIVAIVNDQVISLYDLKQRMLMLLSATGGQVSPQEQRYIQSQALKTLIDEKLQLQEAAEYKVQMPQEDVETAFRRIGEQYRMSAAEFEKYLTSIGVMKSSLLNQLRANMAWDSVVNGLLRPQVSVTDEEVYAVLERLNNNKGKDEYHLREIFLPVTDEKKRQETLQTANRLVQQLREGSPFQVLARQFSQTSTSAVGGDLGWLMLDAIEAELRPALSKMNEADISDPILVDGGYYILEMVRKRQVMTPNSANSILDLKYMFFKVSDKALPREVEALKDTLEKKLAALKSCDDVERLAEEMTAESSGDLGKMRLSDFPGPLQSGILATEIGQAAPLLKEDGGFRALIICGKDVPEIKAPTFESVQSALTNERVTVMARRHLRDLRRDAIIDYR
ncbi:MAG: hypothetical protein CMF31_10075 [Kordiimonas sp.]|nr:hypothetical protein [Kordiimonas sp.]